LPSRLDNHIQFERWEVLMRATTVAAGRVVIGRDPHKRSATIEMMTTNESVVGAGQTVVDVPPKLSARMRVYATGQGRQTDATDAHSSPWSAPGSPGYGRSSTTSNSPCSGSWSTGVARSEQSQQGVGVDEPADVGQPAFGEHDLVDLDLLGFYGEVELRSGPMPEEYTCNGSLTRPVVGPCSAERSSGTATGRCHPSRRGPKCVVLIACLLS
jgi:hypothetical protein